MFDMSGLADEVIKAKKANSGANFPNLNNEDVAVIKYYTTEGGSYDLNQFLGSGNEVPISYKNYEKRLNEALNKVDKYVDKTFRGHPDKVNEDWIKKRYFEGKDVTEPTFFSSSTKRSEALQRIGKDKGNVFYSIDSKTGGSIKNISEHSPESEILFKSKTLFNVISVEFVNEKGGYWFVKMIEK